MTEQPIDEFVLESPATGEEVARYPIMDAGAVDQAVSRARERFASWRQSGFKERRRILLDAASILARRAKEVAERVGKENGKTQMDALLGDVYPAADLMKFYGKKARKFLKPVRVHGNLLIPLRKAYTVFKPKGVVGVIAPWNYPFSLCVGPVVSALAAGNTVVLKPSSQTSGSGVVLKEILDEAGLPPGALEVVTGPGSVTGSALVEHPDLNMIFFTGSTEVGKGVNEAAAKRLIPTIMELGGKDVAIVTRSADIERAVRAIAWSAFTNCGQTCMGTELILVDRMVYDEFQSRFVEVTRRLRCGQGLGEIGAMTLQSQVDLVKEQRQDALDKGARIVVEGEVEEGQEGRFLAPCVLSDTTEEMRVRAEETFGPLKSLIAFDRLENAIEIANRTEYGLSGAVFTGDMKEGRWIASQLDTGSVNINDILITYAMPALPFGGVKASGLGRYHGKMGMRAFTDVQSVTELRFKLPPEPYWYPVPPKADRVTEEVLLVLFSRSPLERGKALMRCLKSVRAAWKEYKESQAE